MWFVFLVNDYLLENLEKMFAILTELYLSQYNFFFKNTTFDYCDKEGWE